MVTYQLSCRLIWEEANQSPSQHRREDTTERERERAAEGGKARGERDAREGAERERNNGERVGRVRLYDREIARLKGE